MLLRYALLNSLVTFSTNGSSNDFRHKHTHTHTHSNKFATLRPRVVGLAKDLCPPLFWRFLRKIINLRPTSQFIQREQIDQLSNHDRKILLLKYSDNNSKTLEFIDQLENHTISLIKRACILCGSEQSTLIGESDYEFRWTCCDQCGFVQLSNQLTHESLNHFYTTGQYQSMCMGGLDDERHFNLESTVMSDVFISVLEILQGERKSTTVAEIGCGSGGILYALQEIGYKTIGFDIDSHRINYGTRSGVKNLYCADALDDATKLPNCNYLILSNVLEHLYDPQKFIGQLALKFLGSSTKLLIDVPNLNGIFHYGKYTPDFFHISHLWYFNPTTLEQLLNKEGVFVQYCFNRGAAMTLICSFASPAASDDRNRVETLLALNWSNRRI